jgi:hypothetical protein
MLELIEGSFQLLDFGTPPKSLGDRTAHAGQSETTAPQPPAGYLRDADNRAAERNRPHEAT